jgi:GDP/UDP-N,N'-diacetylbacillosamine 2-epimerase (hydrolysing)
LSRRRVAYVTGTRADFGLMARALRRLADSPALELGIFATGMHLSPKYGMTVQEIKAAGFKLCAEIPTALDQTSGAAMALAIADALRGLTQAFSAWRPDIVLLLGDRGEMLAGALATVHLGAAVVHVHGGERSGSVDEPVRHAISKLSHYHFVATAQARDRLVRMGERAEHVFVTGAPGLDDLADFAPETREALCGRVSLDPSRPVCLMVFHPVVQSAGSAGTEAGAVLRGILGAGAQALVLMPNADAGGDEIRAQLSAGESHPDVRLLTHLPRTLFLSWVARADAMVGNSSSGIIEAASLGQWVINVGARQQLRERSGNVVDIGAEEGEVRRAVADVCARPRRRWDNVYGDGRAAGRIAELLERLPLEPALLHKVNAY